MPKWLQEAYQCLSQILPGTKAKLICILSKKSELLCYLSLNYQRFNIDFILFGIYPLSILPGY